MDISFSRFGEFSFIPSVWYFPSFVDANNLKVSSFHGVPKCTALFLFFFNFWLTFTEWSGSPPCHPVMTLPQSLSAVEFAWFPECFVSSTTSVWLFSNNSISILNSIFISFINIFISSKSLVLFSWSIFKSSELFQHSYNLFFCLCDLGCSHWYLALIDCCGTSGLEVTCLCFMFISVLELLFNSPFSVSTYSVQERIKL